MTRGAGATDPVTDPKHPELKEVIEVILLLLPPNTKNTSSKFAQRHRWGKWG